MKLRPRLSPTLDRSLAAIFWAVLRLVSRLSPRPTCWATSSTVSTT